MTIKLTEEFMQSRLKELYQLLQDTKEVKDGDNNIDWDKEFKMMEYTEEYNLLKHELVNFYRKKYFDLYLPMPINEVPLDALKEPLMDKTVEDLKANNA